MPGTSLALGWCQAAQRERRPEGNGALLVRLSALLGSERYQAGPPVSSSRPAPLALGHASRLAWPAPLAPRRLAGRQHDGQVAHRELTALGGRGGVQTQAMAKAAVVLVARVSGIEELLLSRRQPRQRRRQQGAVEHLVEAGLGALVGELVGHLVKWDDYGILLQATAGLH